MRQDTNTDRVKRARKALAPYIKADRRLPEVTCPHDVSDLLADLMHFCDTMSHRPGWYFADLLATAEDHHQAERTKA